MQPLKLLYRTNKQVQNRNVTVWVWDPGSIIIIMETSFICGLLRAKVFEGERLCTGGGSEVWSIYHQSFLLVIVLWILFCSLENYCLVDTVGLSGVFNF
ncbi:hypothetical protein Hanom_Chr02g00159531 [Helianthus anomalus]